MSIPPLVCNTPPPPDQCEDDKEDFDINYNLSQENEDEFDFQSFPAYDNYKPNAHEKWEMASEISKNSELAPTLGDNIEIISEFESKEITSEYENTEVILDHENTEITMKCQNKTAKTVDEEVNLEDLNLSVEPQDSNSKVGISNTEEELKKQQLNNVSQAQEYLSKIDIEDKTPNSSLKTDSDSIDSYENALDIQDSLNTEIDIKSISIEDPCLEEPSQTEFTVTVDDIKENDYDEFADFKSNIPSIANDTENPWETSVVEESTISNFKADFDSFHKVNNEDINSNDGKSNRNDTEENISGEEDDDDFGDFDDFQSSANSLGAQEVVSLEGPTSNQGNVWSLGNPESASFTENVNNILGSIFEQELTETECVLENNLEASLGEAWRYLIETDERQPYMVAWNNSSGQKTLLKALCIDSRNILFGPKWSSNMPKYAVTLSNAPLQPQKHAVSNPMTEDLAAEKQSNKQASTWVDPFTTDGQESCNSANENPTTEPRSSNVQMYSTTKNDKIYASTLNIQPIRQINLPDTHIFTPTDSETPRSKTIHYDNSPTILLPKSALENSKSQCSHPDPLVSKDTPTEKVQGEDYWEFQDFKGNSELPPPTQTPQSSVIPSTSVLRETQILQPVKVELQMPTLNWPEPGEVKETFDDFTDFISKSGPSIDNSENQLKGDPLASSIIQHSDIKSIPNTVLSKDLDTNTNQFLDDDFDTFQSALPQSTKTAEDAPSRFNNIESTSSLVTKTLSDPSTGATSQLQLNTNTYIDSFFAETMKSEVVIPKTVVTPNNVAFSKDNIENSGFTPKIVPAQKHDFPPINILQPTQASSSSSTQKAGQILQPLSLESYSQINWPNPGIDLQDLSKFNPVESLQSLKSDLGSGNQSKVATPIHNHKVAHGQDDDIWGEFVSIKPKQQHMAPNSSSFADDDEWSDFMSSPVVKPINGLNTISLNVHANSNNQKNSPKLVKKEQTALGIPTLNYITPKSGGNKSYNIDRHLQRL